MEKGRYSCPEGDPIQISFDCGIELKHVTKIIVVAYESVYLPKNIKRLIKSGECILITAGSRAGKTIMAERMNHIIENKNLEVEPEFIPSVNYLKEENKPNYEKAKNIPLHKFKHSVRYPLHYINKKPTGKR